MISDGRARRPCCAAMLPSVRCPWAVAAEPAVLGEPKTGGGRTSVLADAGGQRPPLQARDRQASSVAAISDRRRGASRGRTCRNGDAPNRGRWNDGGMELLDALATALVVQGGVRSPSDSRWRLDGVSPSHPYSEHRVGSPQGETPSSRVERQRRNWPTGVHRVPPRTRGCRGLRIRRRNAIFRLHPWTALMLVYARPGEEEVDSWIIASVSTA